MTRCVLFGLTVGLALIGGVAHAEDPGRVIDNDWVKGSSASGARTIARDAASIGGGAKTGFAGSGVVVETSQDKTEASLQLSSSSSMMADRVARFQAWTVKATAPLDEDSGRSDFVTDEGLSSDWSLSLSFNHVSAPRSPNPAMTPAEAIAVTNAAGEACKKSGKKDCGTMASELAAWMPEADAKNLFNLQEEHWTKAWTLGASVGRKGFKWRDPLTLAEAEDKHTPYSFSVQWGAKKVGGTTWTTGWFGAIGAEYKQEYKDAKKAIKCLPATSGASLDCYQSPYAKPSRDPSATLYALARKNDAIETLDVPIGLQFKSAYDFESKVVGIEATVYFLTDKDGALNGGVRAKLQTKDDDPDTHDDTFTVGLFVGKSF